MAEPLTTSDMFRIGAGWGTSGDTAERKRWAAAGLSPATTSERERVAYGWGASPLASKESRDAMVMEEISRGMRPASDTPKIYGGRPDITTSPSFDRKTGEPTGAFRRQLRQQQMWDERQKALFDQQMQMEQLELRRREENRLLSDAEADRNAEKLRVKAQEQDSLVKSQAFKVLADTPLGDPFAYTQAVDKLADISGALERDDVRSALGIIEKASASSQQAIARSQLKEAQKLATETENKFIAAGGDDASINEARTISTFVDPNTGEMLGVDPVVYAKELEKRLARMSGQVAKAQKESQSPAAKAAASAEEDIKSERGRLRSSIIQLQDSRAEAESNLETFRPNSPDRKKVESKIATLDKQIQSRQAELESLGGGVQAVPQTPTGQRPPLGDIFGGR